MKQRAVRLGLIPVRLRECGCECARRDLLLGLQSRGDLVTAQSDYRACGRKGGGPQRAAGEVGAWMRWRGGDDSGEVGKMG